MMCEKEGGKEVDGDRKKKKNVIQKLEYGSRPVENSRWRIAFLSKWDREKCRPIETQGEKVVEAVVPGKRKEGLELPAICRFLRRSASSAFQLIYSVHASPNCFRRTCGFIERWSNIKRRRPHSCPPLFRAGPEAGVKESKRWPNNRRAFDSLKMI